MRLLWKPHSSASRTSMKARVIGPLCIRIPGAPVAGREERR